MASSLCWSQAVYLIRENEGAFSLSGLEGIGREAVELFLIYSRRVEGILRASGYVDFAVYSQVESGESFGAVCLRLKELFVFDGIDDGIRVNSSSGSAQPVVEPDAEEFSGPVPSASWLAAPFAPGIVLQLRWISLHLFAFRS